MIIFLTLWFIGIFVLSIRLAYTIKLDEPQQFYTKEELDYLKYLIR